ncbi:hypothetical protein, partial [Sansalvadorimonas verongulae]|uniref:hypothetical protein n=1 Tax=Sansalvadorimonas verongulae TaxID=2172824 RepID=UPI0018AD0FC8
TTTETGAEADSPRQPDPDIEIDEGFRLLETNPQRALTAAAALLAKHIEDPRHYARVVELKAQALFLLKDFDGCIRYIDSLPQSLQYIQEVLLAKARALQALYERHSASFNDKKTNGLALARHILSIGLINNAEIALDIYTQLRTQAAGGMEDTPCDDKDIELALAHLFQFMGGADNQRKALNIYTRLHANGAEELEATVVVMRAYLLREAP